MIQVRGLEQNGYLINNPVILNVTALDPILRLEISFLNQQNGKTASLPNLFPDPSNQEVLINIDKVLKGLFTEPKYNTNYTTFTPQIINENANIFSLTFKITYFGGTQEEFTLQRTFVRGGRYNDETNQYVTSNSLLSISNLLPYFPGYPFAYYAINGSYKIFKYNSQSIQPVIFNIETIREKSCDGKYLVFLNSLGGYSYWYFDNFETEASASNLGIVSNGFSKKDLGNSYDNSFKVFGKIPERFYEYMRDLILSPEIYEYNKSTQSWKRIYSDGNKWVENGAKIAYKVEYKFSDFNNYNPSLL